MSSMYEQFETDRDLETKGVIVNYSDNFRVTLARAGGSNRKYAKLLEQKSRPLRRAIETDTLDNETALNLLKEVYSEAVVLNWEVNENRHDLTKEPKWVPGVEDREGKVQPFNSKEVMRVFRELPDMFTEIQQQASRASLFRTTAREEDAKN